MTEAVPDPGAPRTAGDDSIDLGQVLGTLLAGKWLIAACTGLAVLAGGWFAFTATPIYQGDILLQVERQGSSIPGLSDILGGEQTATSAEVELLSSRMVVGAVVDQLDLAVRQQPLPATFLQRFSVLAPQGTLEVGRFEVEPALLSEEFVLEALGGDAWALRREDTGETLGRGRVDVLFEWGADPVGRPALVLFVNHLDAAPGQLFRLARDSRLGAIRRVAGALTVTERGARRASSPSGMLEVTFQHPDRRHIERVLNALGNSYVRQNVERRSSEAARRLEFLDEQLPLLRVELEQAERAFNDFRRDFQAVDLDAETRTVLNQVVEIDNELNRMRVEQDALQLQFGPDHPQMRAMRMQQRTLETARARLDVEAQGLPERQQDLLRLRREVEVNTALYTALMNSAQELRVAQAGTIGNVRVIDDAAVSSAPVAPRIQLILAISLVLGLLAGMLVVLLRGALRNGIVDPDALEQSLGLPVYAVVPHSDAQLRGEKQAARTKAPVTLIARDDANEPAVESLRSLRTSLNFALMDDERNVVLITSAGPASGKTFLSVNLAWVLGQGGQKVLLIDSDLRRSTLNQYLEGRRRMPGLSEVLSGQCALEDALVALAPGSVDVLPSGRFPPNPSELLMRPAFGELIERVRSSYDLVLIDTPPVLAATDGVIVARHAGPVFVCARAGVTTEREVRTAIRRLAQADVRTTGLLVNDLSERMHGYGGYYYYYYYHYKYPSKAAGNA
jgi:tyrosine-protein kinase Etk/Wzc